MVLMYLLAKLQLKKIFWSEELIPICMLQFDQFIIWDDIVREMSIVAFISEPWQ